MSVWQLLIAAAILLAAVIPVLLAISASRRLAFAVLATVAATFLLGAIALGGFTQSGLGPQAEREELKESSETPQKVRQDEFVSSSSCRSCHPQQYASWHATFHRTMTQWATPEAVLAPFENVELKLEGRTFRLSREGDEFWAELPDPLTEVKAALPKAELHQTDSAANLHKTDSGDGAPTVRRRVVMTTGSHHLQHFWVAGGDGQGLFNLPWEYHIAEKRWIPMMDAHVIPPDHKRAVSQWNSACIICHSVGGVPGLDSQTGEMSTRVAELGIACEACHGPGERHIRHHQNPLNRYRQRSAGARDPTIVNPAKCSSKISTSICGQCHSTFQMVNRRGEGDLEGYLIRGNSYRAGHDLARSIRLLTPQHAGAKSKYPFRHFYTNEKDVQRAFWSDGTARVGGREYLGLMATACFAKGEMSCLSCHSMHNSDPRGQIAQGHGGNQACLQCHTAIGEDLTSHTHHRADSSGSQCYNCHMPHTSFALLRAARSHRVDSPHVTSSRGGVKPNACNLCHLDKTLAWTGEHLSQWYDHPAPNLDKEEKETAASLLWILRGDAAQRAVTAWHFGWKPAQMASGAAGARKANPAAQIGVGPELWPAPFLAELLDDPYSAIRYVAGRSLRNYTQFKGLKFDYIAASDDRAKVKQDVLAQWRQAQPGRSSGPRSALLLNADGSVQQNQVNSLIERRDNRPVEILE